MIVQVLVFISRVIALLVGGRLGNVYLTLALWSISGAVTDGGLSMWNLRMVAFRSEALAVLSSALPASAWCSAQRFWA